MRDSAKRARWYDSPILETINTPLARSPLRWFGASAGVFVGHRHHRSAISGARSCMPSILNRSQSNRVTELRIRHFDPDRHRSFATSTHLDLGPRATGGRVRHHGLDVSHPFFDRELAEFVLSIDPVDLPYDGRSKTVLRQGFADHLPPSVLARRTKTLSDEYLEVSLTPLRAAYRNRYPEVPADAHGYIDPGAYQQALSRFDDQRLDSIGHLALVRAWLLFSWIEGLGGYDERGSIGSPAMASPRSHTHQGRAAYARPVLCDLGSMAVVTRKSSIYPDGNSGKMDKKKP